MKLMTKLIERLAARIATAVIEQERKLLEERAQQKESELIDEDLFGLYATCLVANWPASTAQRLYDRGIAPYQAVVLFRDALQRLQ